jgi:diguanylate cyclase (GGDEF)-like protein
MKQDSLTVNTSRMRKARSSMKIFLREIDEILRRLLDIILSLIGMILLAPLFVTIAFAIKRSSSGPVFYWGDRAGKGGKTFRILKFRTMYERKESYQGPKVTAENDPRITPLGRVLRQTKLNELPQLWNVFIGDMSLVGPRPEDQSIAETWPEAIRKEILSVKPGITSPASVVYRNEEELLQSSNLMDTYLWDILPTKLRLDQLYVRNRSILTDLDVILWTMVALIPRMNSYAVPEHLLYWGPLARFTQRFLGWFVIDFFVALLAVGTAGVIRRLNSPLDVGLQLSVLIALAVALLFSVINLLAGINRINWDRARPQEAFDLAISTAIVSGVIFAANMLFPEERNLPSSVIISTGILAFFGFVAVRYRSRLFLGIANRWVNFRGSSLTSLGEHVLIIGAGEVGRFSTWLLQNETLEKAFTIVGMVDDNPRVIGSMIDGCSVIGSTNAIPELVKKHDIGLILFAIADIDPTEQERILALCQKTPARVIPIPDILESLKAQFPKNDAERDLLYTKVLHNATIDRLTGAYNRHQFVHLAEAEVLRAQRYGHPLSILMVSLDYTRPVSANYTSTTASKVMQQAARKCLENIRGIDLLGRYRTNTLVILLPETDTAAAELVASRLEEAIVGSTVMTEQGSVTPLARIRIIENFDNVSEKGIDHLLSKIFGEMVSNNEGLKTYSIE